MNEINRLRDQKMKELESIRHQKAKLKEIEDNYIRLKEKLIRLPDEIEYDVFIPIAYSSSDNFEFTSAGQTSKSNSREMPLAFMPAKLIHTNEVLVHLGDNWFTDCSARKSSEIAERKLEKCKQQLIDLDKNEKLLVDWLVKLDEFKNDRQQLVEIHEEYNEEDEKKWREKHRENVKKQKEKERLEREASKNEQINISSTINDCIVERDPIDKMSKLNLNNEPKEQTMTTTRPMSKFKQQMLNKKK